ncbi:MAG: hypothetical protein GTN62_11295 [Gemmatimonadales bacterium]|nr:hypothetical protein [Gemmatimonadales bacterium]NIN50680.1 hypothetical protein [Gemmatimonadales bacterium]NIP08144.1 hypothetical protein [Gemmatimonadales bacterium]NIR01022.1 hypothetical protein [Gemmatimonadales bacterium]NIS65101.1 hypothetical protein [Gemmatimonadales bacterium]
MNRERLVYRSLLVVAAAMLACDSDPFLPCETSSSSTVSALRVLFVGNSATYTNELPGMVQDMGSADSLQIETVDVSMGGVDLDYHWNIGSARDSLGNGRWNVVVLQGGWGETFEEYAVIWANAIRAAEARPALYMFCASPAYLAQFDDLSLSYRTAAKEARAELYAAGEACLAAWSIDPDLPLFAPDGHPSVMGSYLAALTIYRGITGREPPSLTNLGISAADDAVLQAAAAAAQPISH